MKNDLKVSLVVTVKNDFEGLKKLLVFLETQSRRPDEVVVTVAGAKEEEIASFKQDLLTSFSIKIIALSKEATRSTGRNMGVNVARYPVILFTDAGCFPEENWVKNITDPFQKNQNTQLVSGLTLGKTNTAFSEAQIPFVLVSPKKIGHHPLPATRNMAIRKALYKKLGGMRDELNYAEDYEFSRRLVQSGVVPYFAPKAKVFWQPRSSLFDFAKMILFLTAGDIQAGILRHSAITMWVRYIVFISTFLMNSKVGLGLYLAYLGVKGWRLSPSSQKVALWHLVLQPVCDASVLAGTLLGLVWRIRSRDNRTHV